MATFRRTQGTGLFVPGVVEAPRGSRPKPGSASSPTMDSVDASGWSPTNLELFLMGLILAHDLFELTYILNDNMYPIIGMVNRWRREADKLGWEGRSNR